MSRGATLMLGVLLGSLAVGFLGVAYFTSNLDGQRAPTVGGVLLAGFCAIGALACLLPASRPVTLRLVGGTVFLAFSGYLIDMLMSGKFMGRSRADPSLVNALVAFSAFGLPAGYVALTGRYPRWGRYAPAFGVTETRRRPPTGDGPGRDTGKPGA